MYVCVWGGGGAGGGGGGGGGGACACVRACVRAFVCVCVLLIIRVSVFTDVCLLCSEAVSYLASIIRVSFSRMRVCCVQCVSINNTCLSFDRCVFVVFSVLVLIIRASVFTDVCLLCSVC